MRVRYSQWAISDRWLPGEVEGLIEKLKREGWEVFDQAENADVRQVWFELPDGQSGIDIYVCKEDLPA